MRRFSVAVIAGLGLLTGCASVQPVPIEPDFINDQLALDQEMAQENVEPILGPLTLEEAIARAIKYNLDHRARLIEQAIAHGEFDLSRYDMLPSVLADAGYTTRNKPLLTTSRTLEGADPEAEGEAADELNQQAESDVGGRDDPSVGTDNSKWELSLGLSWSLVDFGSSYYAAKQNADRLLIAMEGRRRAMHLLIMDVQTAYWRAASAQELEHRVRETIEETREAIEAARESAELNELNPLINLRHQRVLLTTLRSIHRVQEELSAAKVELANLINAPFDADFDLDPGFLEPPGGDFLDRPLSELELVALYNNADLKVPFYQARIAAAETRRALLDLMPGIQLDWGPRYTTDSFVINNQWNQGAVSITWNLLNVLRAGDVMDNAKAREELAQMRRAAVQMSVVTQVHLARLLVQNSADQFETAEDLLSVDKAIESHQIRGFEAGTTSRAEVVSAKAAAIVTEMERYQALAKFYTASGQLQAALGVEPDISSLNDASLEDIRGEVRGALERWHSGDEIQSKLALIDMGPN